MSREPPEEGWLSITSFVCDLNSFIVVARYHGEIFEPECITDG